MATDPKCKNDGNVSLEAAGYTISRAADLTLQIYPPIGSAELGTVLSIHFPLQKTLVGKLKAAFQKHVSEKWDTSFTIIRASDQTFEFNPPAGSIELATALSISFPLESNLEKKAQAAILEYVNEDPAVMENLKENDIEQNLVLGSSKGNTAVTSMTSGSYQTQNSEDYQQDLEAFRFFDSISSEVQLDFPSIQSREPPKPAILLEPDMSYKPSIPGTSAWDLKTGEIRQNSKRRCLGLTERKQIAQKRRDRSVCQSCRSKKIKCDPKTCPGNKLFDPNLLLETSLWLYQGRQRRLFCSFPDCKHGSGKGFASLKKAYDHVRRNHKEFEDVSVELGINQATHLVDQGFESSTQADEGSAEISQLSLGQLSFVGDVNGSKENDKSFQQADTLDDWALRGERVTMSQFLSAQSNLQYGIDLEGFTDNTSSANLPLPLLNNTDYSTMELQPLGVLEDQPQSQCVLNPFGNSLFRMDYESNPWNFSDLGFEMDFAIAPERVPSSDWCDDEEEDEESSDPKKSRRDPRNGGGYGDSHGSGDGDSHGSSNGYCNDNHGSGPGSDKGGSGGSVGTSGSSSSSSSSRTSHDLAFYYWQWKTSLDAKHSPAQHSQETKACATLHAPIAPLCRRTLKI